MAEGKVVTHDALVLAGWGHDEPDNAIKSLRVLLCHLRKKLGAGSIGSVHGVGYVMPAEVAAKLPALDDRVLVPAKDFV